MHAVALPALTLVAGRNFAYGKWEAGKIVQIGLDDLSAVNLVLGADI